VIINNGQFSERVLFPVLHTHEHLPFAFVETGVSASYTTSGRNSDELVFGRACK
jgi:hypothetical protein